MDSDKSIKRKLAFIVHDEQNVPRYYQINKGLFKLIIISFPALTLLCVMLLIAGFFYYQNIKGPHKKSDTGELLKHKNKYEELVLEIKTLEENNQELRNRLTTNTSTKFDVLNLIQFTPGQQDKSAGSSISIEGQENKIIPVFDSKKLHLRFNLLNNTPDTRHAGFLFVVMKTENALQIYPDNAFSENEMQIIFNRGEVFGFNKLRFVQASFDLPVKFNKIIFKVILFNKLGDLIFNESIPYENTGKPQ